MKTIPSKFLICLVCALTSVLANAENGLEKIIVEKYNISNAADSAASIGILPVGSVTYRIYADLLPGYKFQMAYGSLQHTLFIKTNTSFFNNEDRGSTNPNYSKAQAKRNTVMLDSWLSAGAACAGNFGILKSEDDSVATVVNSDGVLQNNDTTAGIPLTEQDGLIAGVPGIFGSLGIDSALSIFDAASQVGNSFIVTSGSWYCLAGAVGPKPDNKVLIAQVTTDGILSFELNLAIGKPNSGEFGVYPEYYVAKNPGKLPMSTPGDTVQEIMLPSLTYTSSDTVKPVEKIIEIKNSEAIYKIYPNPTHGQFSINISSLKSSPNDYYTIYNMVGNMVLKKKIENNSGNYIEKSDISSFANGIYFIEISVNGNKITLKIIKE